MEDIFHGYYVMHFNGQSVGWYEDPAEARYRCMELNFKEGMCYYVVPVKEFVETTQ